MYVQYGNYQFAASEAGVVHTKRAERSRRNTPFRRIETLTFSGKLLSTAGTEADMRTRLNAMIDEFSEDGKDAGLYHTDGSRSPHFLDSSSSLSGVRVVAVSFPTPEQVYATNRDFSVTLEADYLASGADQIVEFVETLEIIGTTGPRDVYVELLEGVADPQTTNLRTVTRAIQSGHAIGFLARPLRPQPIWPALEDEPVRRIMPTGPRRDGNRFVDWGIQWTYFFQSNQPLMAEPNFR